MGRSASNSRASNPCRMTCSSPFETRSRKPRTLSSEASSSFHTFAPRRASARMMGRKTCCSSTLGLRTHRQSLMRMFSCTFGKGCPLPTPPGKRGVEGAVQKVGSSRAPCQTEERRAGARGLQDSTGITVSWRPRPLTGRVFKQALRTEDDLAPRTSCASRIRRANEREGTQDAKVVEDTPPIRCAACGSCGAR